MRELIRDIARELQDPEHIRWSEQDLVDYTNQTLFDMVRNRPDLTAKTVTLCLTQGTYQETPGDVIQLISVVRNTNGRAVRLVSKEAMDASAGFWHARTPSNTIRDYIWRESEPDRFYVFPPAAEAAKVEAIVSMRPRQIDSPSELIDLRDEPNQTFVYETSKALLLSIARDLMIGLDWASRGFVEGLFGYEAEHRIDRDKRCPASKSWSYLREAIGDMFPQKDRSSIDNLVENVRNVFDSKDDYVISRAIEPKDLDSPPTANLSAYTTIMDEALQGSVIGSMWASLVANADDECGTNVDWGSNALEDLARRDALGLISAVAQDIALGTTTYTRAFIDGLYIEGGEAVFPDEQRCGFKYAWDQIVQSYSAILDADTLSDFEALVGLAKDSVDDPAPGLLKVEAPDIADTIAQDEALGRALIANHKRLLDRVLGRTMEGAPDDCPNLWPTLPVPIHWRDTVMDGVTARALARNTDGASIERAQYHWERFNGALGVQRAAQASFRPGRGRQAPQRSNDE